MELYASKDYDKDLLADRVAFLAVYVPILQQEIFEFTRFWNNVHAIRKQKARSHVVSGIPWLLYYYPETTDGEEYGINVPPESLHAYQEAFEGFGTSLVLLHHLLFY